MSFDQKTGLIKFQPILTDLYFKICGKYQGVKKLHLLAHIGCKMALPMSPTVSPSMSSYVPSYVLYVPPDTSMFLPMCPLPCPFLCGAWGTPVSAIPLLCLLFPLLSLDMGT